jgi:Ca-activated chloride channel family protein
MNGRAFVLGAGILLLPPAELLSGVSARTFQAGGELRVAGESHSSLPLLHTAVRVEIAANVARTELTQTFRNPYDRSLEAVYVFPLPHRAAVNDMEIRVADTTIRGVIGTREEARRVYDEAKARGALASLLDQERPNIFTQSLAGILPEEEIKVTLRYFESLAYAAGEYELVVPTVVGPRFIPGEPIALQARGWSPDTDAVPDASRITPPVLRPSELSGHELSLEVAIDAGASIGEIHSPSHEVDLLWTNERSALVRLRPEDSIPNRDFVLRYRLEGKAPQAALVAHRENERGYFALLIYPEREPAPSRILPKEMVFVVDCSGSMTDLPIEKVKEALRYSLEGLNPDDTFQIIRFSVTAEKLAERALPAEEAHLERAREFVESLSGEGGTIVLEGVREALLAPEEPDRLRIVAFMTDGYIGNEAEILRFVASNVGKARLFAFGVGNAVNRYFLDKIAEVGRGTTRYVLLEEDSAAAIRGFYDGIRDPYLTDVELDWGSLAVTDVYPLRLPDLFVGRPLVVYGRYSRPSQGVVTVKARMSGEPFRLRAPVVLPAAQSHGQAIGRLWARARIEDLSLREALDPRSENREQITRVALEHNLVSAYTSFVAVEERFEPHSEQPVLVEIPVYIPAGVSYEGFFGPIGAGGGMRFGLTECWNSMGAASKLVNLLLLLMAAWTIGAALERVAFLSWETKQARLLDTRSRAMGERVEALGELASLLEREVQPSSGASVYASTLVAARSFSETGENLSVRRVLIGRAIGRAKAGAVARLQCGRSSLIAIAITAPLVGLGGAVIGLENALQGVSLTSSPGFLAVAAGMAEALVPLAFGLAVGIAAAWAYAWLVTRARRLALKLETGAWDLLQVFRAVDRHRVAMLPQARGPRSNEGAGAE